MNKLTKLSVQWFYDLLERGECDIMDLKEQLEDKNMFGKSIKNFAPNYEDLAKDVVAFANKKGGFLFVGIVDKTKEINPDFAYSEEKTFDLIRQIQDRTKPTVTLIPHTLTIDRAKLLILEIPFSTQLHCTSRGEYIVRSNNGNKAIEPHEIYTIMAEKNLLAYDQKPWDVRNWQDERRTQTLLNKIKSVRADSPLLKKSFDELNGVLSFVTEDLGDIKPTTTGILFIGNDKALKRLPYSEINYVRYSSGNRYQSYIWQGNLIEIIDDCFTQMKAEIQRTELEFGLYHEFVEDYPEVAIREILINAVAHRDYSRHMPIQIRKYPTCLEIESPGTFLDGIDETNYLRKSASRNPNIMDVLRTIRYAEKAGSGFDKIFTSLLSRGKRLPEVEVTDSSVSFRLFADIYSNKLIELSLQHRQTYGEDMDVDTLLILNEIINHKRISFAELAASPFVSESKLHGILEDLLEKEFIETTGKTSGMKYILHKTKNVSTEDKINYTRLKKQNKARQKEAILRYLDEIDTISNSEARLLLKLTNNDRYYVTRLFNELLNSGDIEVNTTEGNNKNRYQRKK